VLPVTSAVCAGRRAGGADERLWPERHDLLYSYSPRRHSPTWRHRHWVRSTQLMKAQYHRPLRAHATSTVYCAAWLTLSYVVANTNFNNSDFEKLNQKEVPDVVRARRAAFARRSMQYRSSVRSAYAVFSTPPGAGAQIVPELAPQGQAAYVEAAAHGHRRVGGLCGGPEARDRAFWVRVRAVTVQPGGD